MREKTQIELQRQRISLLVRAQGSIVRAEFVNATLPQALAAFDASVLAGEPVQIEPVNLDAIVAAAVAEITSVTV